MASLAASPPVRSLPGLPLLGNLLEFRRRPIDMLLRVARECGDIGVIKLGPVPVHFVSSAELAQQVFVEHDADFQKSRGLQIARSLLGEGLLTSEGAHHKRQRRLMAPAFTQRRVAAFATTMAELGERAAARLADGATVDVLDEMMRLTLAVVGKTLFSSDMEDSADRVADALTVAMRWLIVNVASPLRLPLSWPTPGNRAARRAMAQLDEVVFRMIREHRQADPKSEMDRGDLLSMLLAARDEDDGGAMSDHQVRAEVLTLVLAGHETTANALTWAFHLIGRAPEVAARLKAEVDAALAGRTPTLADLAALPYALATFKEAMRLYPPAYIVGREALRPVRIGDHLLPAGAIVFVNVIAMNRRPDYFPDPERFDPGRFLPEREKQIPRGAFTLFGGGSRICIGNHFALMEGQILLATLTQRVAFTPLPGVPAPEMEPLVTLRPKHGLPMKVKRHPPQPP